MSKANAADQGENASQGGAPPPPILVVGISIPQLEGDASRLLKISRDDEYDFITTMLPVSPTSKEQPPREDVLSLDSKWWRTSIVGRCCDNFTNPILDESDMDTVLKQLPFQIEWAMHMNIPAVLLPPMPPSTAIVTTTRAAASSTVIPTVTGGVISPPTTTTVQTIRDNPQFMEYTRILSSFSSEITTTGTSMQLWVPISLNHPSQITQFDALHQLCESPNNIGCILFMEPQQPPPAGGVGGPMGAVSTVIPPSNPSAAAPFAITATATAAAYPHTGVTTANQLSMIHQSVGNNLKAVCFPTNVFLTNKRGYPTLSKSHQALFSEILRRLGRTIRVLIEGPSVHMTNATGVNHNTTVVGSTGCLTYLQYIQHLRKRSDCLDVLDTSTAIMETPYLDSLQRPLQPLKDHLEFGTYETFEKDPIKYNQYREAILVALSNLIKNQQLSLQQQHRHHAEQDQHADADDDDDDDDDDMANCGDNVKRKNSKEDYNEITVMIAGAGRGPLLTCALEAWERICTDFMGTVHNTKKFNIYGIEKNPSAIIYLQSMQHNNPLWKKFASNIHIVNEDLRYLTSKQIHGRKADIVVSELLGSFGDNELSPECLYGLFHNNNTNINSNKSSASSTTSSLSDVCKATTISIPMRYTAHLAPCTSQKLYSEAKGQSFLPLECDRTVGRIAALETPYVVRSHSAAQTHLEQDCWTFVHPPFIPANVSEKNSSSGTERSCHLLFESTPSAGAGLGSGYGPIDLRIINAANAPVPVPGSVLPPGMAPLPGPPITIHGFIGTFTADLFVHPMPPGVPVGHHQPQSIQISTAPSQFSKDMCSWFPLYFPLHQPLLVPQGATLSVSLWRKTDCNKGGTKVWYEWAAKVYRTTANQTQELLGVTPIHNINGRSYHVTM